MEDPEAMLKEIKRSLVPERILVKPKPKPIQKRKSSLDSLLTVCDKVLDRLDKEKERDRFVVGKLDRFESRFEQFTSKVDANLQSIMAVQKGLQHKIDSFTVLEAKYTRMIARVNGVLEELERVLRLM